MEKIKISIITICYNRRDDLLSTIKSVVEQLYDNIEYIIVDGGSTDGTKDILEEYKECFSHCISEPDNGIYDAMNKGIRIASGEWIIMMNAGDIFAKRSTLKDIFSMPIPNNISALYSDYILRNENGKETLCFTDRTKGRIHHQNFIYRRTLHKRFGLYVVTNPYIVSDLLFMMAIPAYEYMKIPQLISIVQDGGVSTGKWVYEQLLCVQTIYGIHSFPKMVLLYAKSRIGLLLRMWNFSK